MTSTGRPFAVWVFAALLPAVVSAQEPVVLQQAPEQPPSAGKLVQAPNNEPVPENLRRPYRGLFAPPADPRVSRQSLDLSLHVNGAYDDDVYAAEASTSSLYRQSGWYAGASAGLDYSRPGERFAFAAGADAGVNRYENRDETLGAYRTKAGLSAALTRKTRLRVAQSFSYAPEYRLGLFVSPTALAGALDPFAPVVPDLDIYRLKNYRFGSEVSLTQTIGRRSALEGTYALLRADYSEDRFDYRAQMGGARFLHQLTRHASLRAGYFYNVAGYLRENGVRNQRVHNIDAGVDYGRALSFSRRTSINFSTGSAVLVRDDLARPDENRELWYRIIGDANLRHEIGRTWTTQLGYRRGVDFHEGFNEPFLLDSVNARIGGFLSRRARFGATTDYARGTVGVDTNNRFDSVSATSGMEFALSRNYALYGRYLYYRYGFDNNVALDPRFLRELDRQGVRFGLAASFALIR